MKHIKATLRSDSRKEGLPKDCDEFRFIKASGLKWSYETVIVANSLDKALEIFGSDEYSYERLPLDNKYDDDIYEIKVVNDLLTCGYCHKK